MASIAFDFSETVALVTGAASGLGLATAQAFAASGAKVVLSDIDQASLDDVVTGLRAEGHDVTGIACDVADDAQVKALVERTVDAYGRLDAAFNNAGIVPPAADITEIAEEEYRRVLDINLKGVWSAMKYELQQMRRQGSGAIVNCSSMAGLIGAAGRSSYIAAKHGIVGLTKGAAVEYAAKGIRINAVCPGTIATPLVARMVAEKDLDLAAAAGGAPIGRVGQPSEIADVVLWLCSPGSTYVIGQSISVDGGVVIQ